MSEPSLARRPWWRRWFGTRSERSAARYLKKLGYRVLARNYSCPLGELDLIALDRGTIVFVEVRSTGAVDSGKAAASVDLAKQTRLTRLALYYLQRKQLLGKPARFDVLTVSWPAEKHEPEITHYAQAFEATGRGQMY